MKRALDPNGPVKGENQGFIRDGAYLAIIFLTDEDDASVKDNSVFNLPQNTVGGLNDYRVQPLFAYKCDTPINAGAGGTYSNCSPRTDSYLQDPAFYSSFLAGVKNPSQTVVAVIAGPPPGLATNDDPPVMASAQTITTGPLSINGGPKCQLEGPMTGGGGAGGTGGGGGAGGAGFCGGDTPRMVVNGVTTTPTVVGQEMILDCCRAARFVVTTSDFSQPIAFDWRWEGPGPLPASISLTNLPDRWRVSLQAGCSVTQPSCLGALDNFTTGFTGQLLVSSFDGGPGFEMNLCLHFTEPAGMPGTILHTLDLYAPHVSTRN